MIHQPSGQAVRAGGDHSSALDGTAGYSERGPICYGIRGCCWNGIGAPGNTPTEIIDRLNREINAGLAGPELKERFAELGVPVFPGSPADFGKFITEATEKWAKVVRFAGAKPD